MEISLENLYVDIGTNRVKGLRLEPVSCRLLQWMGRVNMD